MPHKPSIHDHFHQLNYSGYYYAYLGVSEEGWIALEVPEGIEIDYTCKAPMMDNFKLNSLRTHILPTQCKDNKIISGLTNILRYHKHKQLSAGVPFSGITKGERGNTNPTFISPVLLLLFLFQ